MPDELYELMRCVPATRHFTDEPVPREALERVFEQPALRRAAATARAGA